jgi:hypothetical protein
MKDKKVMLYEVRVELLRFLHKLDEAIEDTQGDQFYSKKFAACKRSAMDLKNELSKITQSSKYLQNG